MHHVADGEHAPPNVDAVAGHPSVAKGSALQNVHNRPLRLTARYAHAALAKNICDADNSQNIQTPLLPLVLLSPALPSSGSAYSLCSAHSSARS